MSFGVGTPLATPQSFGQTSGFTAMDPLTIGSVTFYDEESPANLEIELTQAWAIHTLVGGSRVAQALGTVPMDIEWSGKLWSGNVLYRFSQLQQMQAAAQQVTMSFLDQAYNVVIKSVKKTYSHRWEGEYKIVISVISDQSGQYSGNPPKGIDSQINAISQAAQNALTQLEQQDKAGSAQVQTEFNNLFTAIEVAGVLEALTSGEAQALINEAALAYAAAVAYANGLGPGGPNGGGGIGGNVLPAGVIVPSQTVITSNGYQPAFLIAIQLASYAQLIIKNLSRGQSPAIIVIQGGTVDLFDVATQYYGDPSLAFPLAAANGLITPQLSSTEIYPIVLPPLQSSNQPAST